MEVPGQAEVQHDRLAAGIDQDVGELEVAVDDAVAVRFLQGPGEGQDQLGRPARRPSEVGRHQLG
jgi:hypothetical protein